MPNWIPQRILELMLERQASDLHASQAGDLWLRIHGELERLDGDTASLHQDLSQWVSEQRVQPGRDLEGSIELPGRGRFRTHLYRMMNQWALVFRAIPLNPPELSRMEVPGILGRIPQLSRGLVLVTGATGSGKSTTLAALIGEINSTLHRHIVTIEDPVEFVHTPKLSRLSQREVGRDTEGFASALRSALREDPDVILVGEMRDPETMDVALKAAETGHLVFSTAHTPDAIRTIARLVAMFPPEAQRLVRIRLAENLGALISQRLVRRANGKGRIAAMEIVLGCQSTREAIEDPTKTEELLDLVNRSGDGQSFEHHLVQLYLDGKITLEEAKDAATNAADLERALKFGEVSAGRLQGTGEAAVQLAEPQQVEGKNTKSAEKSSESAESLAAFFHRKAPESGK